MKNLVQFLLATALFLFLSIETGYAQKTYKKGEKILIPASVGTNESIIGTFYSKDFNRISSLQNNIQIQSIEENTYRSDFEILESRSVMSSALKAFSFFNFSTSQFASEKHAILSAYQIRRIENIPLRYIEYQPQNSMFIVSGLYYGWSLNYLLSGSKQSFSNEFALEIQNAMTKSGISIQNQLSTNNIRHKLEARGLEQNSNSVGVSVNREEINQNYREGEPVLIFMELTLLKDYDPTVMDWQMIIEEDHTIEVSEISIAVASRKLNGGKWDNLSESDMYVEVYLGNELIDRTKPIENTLSISQSIAKRFKFSELQNLRFEVFDKDGFTGSDHIGTCRIPVYNISGDFTSDQVTLYHSGQVQLCSLKFIQ